MAFGRSSSLFRRAVSYQPLLARHQRTILRSLASNGSVDVNVPINFLSGKLHAKFPLVSKPGLADISLNRASTVQDLADKLKAADSSIQAVEVLTLDGVKVAQLSQIGPLTTKDVIVEYGTVRLRLQSPSLAQSVTEESHLSAVIQKVSALDQGAIREDALDELIRETGATNVAQIKAGLVNSGLMARLDDVSSTHPNPVYVYSGSNSSTASVLFDTAAELKTKLEHWTKRTEDLEAQEKQMAQLEQTILKRANSRAAMKKLAVLGFLTTQFGVLFYFVYDVYSWDIMEPFGYFLGAGYGLAAALYFSLTKKDPTYGHLLTTSQAKTMQKLSKQVGYNAEAHEALKHMINEHQTALALLRTRVNNSD